MSEKPFVIRCRWCGKFMRPGDGNYHFEPDAEMHPEEEWWEHAVCPKEPRHTPADEERER